MGAPDAYEVDIEVESHKEQLRQFTDHCRIFYRNSLCVSETKTLTESDPDDVEFDASTNCATKRHSMEASAAVLQAFEALCASRKSLDCMNEIHRSAIAQCGFLDSDFLTGEEGKMRLSSYCKARDKERLNAHEYFMNQRKIRFFDLLKAKDVENDLSDMNATERSSLFPSLQIWERERNVKNTARAFCHRYKSKIGVHPWLAGLRNLFEMQIKHTDNIVKWNFDVATLTENCDGDDALIHDALNVMNALLSKDEDSDDEKKEESMNVCTTTWSVNDIVSNKLLGRIINILPHPRDLHAKPTGTFVVSNEIRTPSEDVVCADNWCVIL